MKKYIFFVIMLVVTSWNAWSQVDSLKIDSVPLVKEISPTQINGSYLKSYFTGIGQIIVSPIHWTGREWIKTGLYASTAIVIYTSIDEPLKDFTQRNALHGTTSNKLAKGFRVFGSGEFTTGAGLVFFLAGNMVQNNKLKRVGLLSLQSVLITGGLVQVVKHTLGRSRPYLEKGNKHWIGFNTGADNASFFSGHTTSAFSLATVLAHEYSDEKWLAPLAYGLASMAGLSRIYDNYHWASDVFVGAVLGTYMTKILLRQADKLNTKLTFSPQINPFYKGLSANYSF